MLWVLIRTITMRLSASAFCFQYKFHEIQFIGYLVMAEGEDRKSDKAGWYINHSCQIEFLTQEQFKNSF